MGVHILAVPLPAQGHMNPMMRLCRKLAEQGALVTFVEADPIHLHIQQTKQQQQQQEEEEEEEGDHRLPSSFKAGIKRAHVPMEGLQLSNDFAVSLKSLWDAFETMTPHLHDLLLHLNQSGPPVTCIVSDFWLTVPTHQRLADAFQIPRFAFYPSSQSLLLLSYYLLNHPTATFDHALQVVAKHPPRPWLGDAAEVFAEGLEGLPSVIRAGDLLHFYHLSDENQYGHSYWKQALLETLQRSSGILVTSFDELEAPAFKCLADHVNLPIYGVGPLVEPFTQESTTSLWTEDDACLQWLDKQPPKSVLYISFGSITILSQTQFDEIVEGLLLSRQRFLWAVRPNLVQGASDGDSHLLDKLLSEGRGCTVKWAPQLKVLAHPSTGGFLTHCGWNSTIEAIYYGVPMLCWPYFGDQFFDAKYIVEEWKIGLGFNPPVTHGQSLVDRREVERAIKALVQGESGNVLRENAAKLKEASHRALSPDGSLHQNIRAFLNSLRTNQEN